MVICRSTDFSNDHYSRLTLSAVFDSLVEFTRLAVFDSGNVSTQCCSGRNVICTGSFGVLLCSQGQECQSGMGRSSRVE